VLVIQTVSGSLPAAAEEASAQEAQQAGPLTKGVQAVVEDAKALATAPFRMDREDLLLTGGALAVVGGLFAADRGIRVLAERNSNSTGRDVADGFSHFGSAAALLGLNAGVIAIGVARESYGGGSQLKEAGLVSLEAELFAVAVTSALKALIGRAGPDKGQGTTHFRPFSGLDTSFPSTHAAASFAVASVFAERFEPPVGWVAYGLASAVAVSRVYTDKHFASDVVAGGLIGWGLGKFLSGRHPEQTSSWRLEPVLMHSGMDLGLVVGKRF
jgi:membrane-associated phospholipid phosphatase